MTGQVTSETPDDMKWLGVGDRSQHIAVGIDGTVASRAAIRWALSHARAGDVVELVHAFERSPADSSSVGPADDEAVARRLTDRELAHAQALAADPAVDLRASTVQGPPRERLAEWPADLLVVGADTTQRFGEHLRGTVGRHLARHVARPLVIVPFPTTSRNG